MGSERQVRRLAETLVRHSVKAKKGEIVGSPRASWAVPRPGSLPEVLRAGAHPLLSVGFERRTRSSTRRRPRSRSPHAAHEDA